MKPKRYTGVNAREISFPLGGIGSGCVGLGGAGHLIDWEIFNRPAKGSRNGFTHFAVKAQRGGQVLDARVLHGDVPPPYAGSGRGVYGGFGFGVARETLSGLPHFRTTTFTGGFPIAELTFDDPGFPGTVEMTAFNPFIPHNDPDSSIPAAFFAITVHNPTPDEIDYTIAFSARNPASGATTNRFRSEDPTRLLHMTGDADPSSPSHGDFAVAADAHTVHAQEYWYRGRWFDNLGVYWHDFAAPGNLVPRAYPEAGSGDHGTVAATLRARPGATATVRFVFSWNVPNCHAYWKTSAGGPCCCGDEGGCEPRATWRNYYATRFPDAAATARYALTHWERLEAETRLFRDTLFSSSLPPQVLDAVSANLSILKSPTCLRLEDGSFYAWEGCHAEAGCCEGSCTHVWNYAYALPFLFPALERSLRELDYGYNLRPDGGMAFRLQLPLGSERSSMRPCVDGQFGGVLKTYREWKISGNTAWLSRLWPAVRSSIEFAWSESNEDRWDTDLTGVIHGRQHHTLDMELFGPSSWLTGFYLAALKAGAEMAEACEDHESSATYRRLFARGSEWVDRNLYNGEYFVQLIDLNDRATLEPFQKDPRIWSTYWSDEHHEVKYQIGEGCGIDQVLAQWHADLIGLGDVFDRDKTRRALQAVHRHNYRSSMRDVVNPCRLYALDGEAGTQMVAWPDGVRKPMIPVPYAEETMHGFEYQAASHMIMNGMVDEGLELVSAVRDRYDGERRNPWNEIECGSNYARSLASYALLNAYSGLRFDATRDEIGFAPVAFVRGRFRCFWALGSAWGAVDIRNGRATLTVLSGALSVRRLLLPLREGETRAMHGRRRIRCRIADGTIELDEAVTIAAGETLRIAGSMDTGS